MDSVTCATTIRLLRGCQQLAWTDRRRSGTQCAIPQVRNAGTQSNLPAFHRYEAPRFPLPSPGSLVPIKTLAAIPARVFPCSAVSRVTSGGRDATRSGRRLAAGPRRELVRRLRLGARVPTLARVAQATRGLRRHWRDAAARFAFGPIAAVRVNIAAGLLCLAA